MNGTREEQAGIGELSALDGRVLLSNARYSLTIEHAEIAGGLPSIHGQILDAPSEGFPAAFVDTEVLLRLEDGREWDCRLTDTRGSLAPRGEHLRRAAS
jgi:hypothetical protein